MWSKWWMILNLLLIIGRSYEKQSSYFLKICPKYDSRFTQPALSRANSYLKKEMRKIQMLVHNDDDSAANHLDVMKTYSAHWFELKLNPSFDSCIVWIQTETKVYLNRSYFHESEGILWSSSTSADSGALQSRIRPSETAAGKTACEITSLQWFYFYHHCILQSCVTLFSSASCPLH